MVKILLIFLSVLLISGCLPTKKLDIIEVRVPVIYCPKPPLIQRPKLPIETITNFDKEGDVAKKYKATVKTLQNYSIQLEQVVKEYDEIGTSTIDQMK